MRPLRRRIAPALAVAALLAVPSAAQAQRCVAPPGTSAVDQYCERIPDAGGDKPTAGGPPSGGSGAGPGVPGAASKRAALASGGEDGRRLAQLTFGTKEAAKDAGKRAKRHRDAASSKQQQASAAPAKPPGGNPLDAVATAVESGDTVGSGFIWALAALTVVMVGGGWLRHRSQRR